MGFAIQLAGITNPITYVRDGYEAVDYLSKVDGENNASYPMPVLMLLDLKMPRMDGFGVLTWLQGRREYDSIAVVVLSSSNLDCDISRAKALGADDYLVKPSSHMDMVSLLRAVSLRWLNEAKTVESS